MAAVSTKGWNQHDVRVCDTIFCQADILCKLDKNTARLVISIPVMAN